MKIPSQNISINQQTQVARSPSQNGHWTLPETTSPSTTVTLSEEGKKRSQDYGQVLKQPSDSAVSQQEDKVEDGDIIDKQIERVKEQMREIKEELQALQGDNSEEAEDRKELLTSQLMGLSAQLLELNNQKLLKEKKARACK